MKVLLTKASCLQTSQDSLSLLLLHRLLQLGLELRPQNIDLRLLISLKAAVAGRAGSLTQITELHSVQAKLRSTLSNILQDRL